MWDDKRKRGYTQSGTVCALLQMKKTKDDSIIKYDDEPRQQLYLGEIEKITRILCHLTT